VPLTGVKFNARNLVFVVMLISASAALMKVSGAPAATKFQVPSQPAVDAREPARLQTHFVTHTLNIHTHAASLVELGDGSVRAFWFAGSQEGASDVEIRSAIYDNNEDSWGPEQTVVTRPETQHGLMRYVKKLGNPVAYRGADGTLHLYYVTVSLGGWAGSSITTVTSNDDGASWSAPRRLITSPFMNISTLVKGTPIEFSDGQMGLPIYHEFIGKFGELLRIDQSGDVVDKIRLSHGKQSLQPIVLIQSPDEAITLMRYAGEPPKRVWATTTSDAGAHWTATRKTSLANPDSAISGVTLPDGTLLVVANDSERGRNTLSLLASTDRGDGWTTLFRLEQQPAELTTPDRYAQTLADLASKTESGLADAYGYAKSAQRTKCESSGCGFEFSYPYLIRTRNGDFHLVYTWNRSFIKHVRFNLAWLQEQKALVNHREPH
jgi:predicted neuraminidase